ncbi:MAG TPA: prenyltransferase/squalene oxidase repeat-containing protein, partial [Planctomycetota bacterium]|nr:prenyltransferase/squalene oxidase repeat-containing protein [Planctomycetota bacterium]
SGWYFEYRNPWYPDVDDTVMVAMALRRIGTPDGIAASERSARWVLAMQNEDGGWSAFDRTRDRPLLEYVPFADHNAMQDPSCADITGRALESLGQLGFGAEHPAVRSALEYLKRTATPGEGCWYGRWGVNYIYGTYQVLVGLEKVGVDMSAPWVRKAAKWLQDVQKEDGSFGESADSYEDPARKGRGPSTASQTAWGTMGLLSVLGPSDPSVRRGVAWLLETQLDSGTWDEQWFTGTGFPRVFYLRYHLYRLYFPLLALAKWVGAR